MGAKGAKNPSSGQPSAYRSLRMSSSSLGQAIPLVYGETRVAHNLIWADWFTAIKGQPPTTAKAGGLAASYTYNYTVSCILALAEGAMAGDGNILHVGRATPGAQVMNVGDTAGNEVKPQPAGGIAPGVWKAKKVRTLDDRPKVNHKPFKAMHFHDWNPASGWPDGTRFVTAPGDVMSSAFKNKQSPNPAGGIQHQLDRYISSTNEQYPGIACSAIQNMALGSNASIPNLNWPLRGLEQYVNRYGLTSGGFEVYDADPACIVFDVLTNEKHGAGWDRELYKTLLAGYVDAAHPYAWGQRIPGASLAAAGADNSWSAYCRANAILLSPLYDQQQSAAQILQDLAQATNTAIVWSEGLLKMIPYGDIAVPASELDAAYTPHTDPNEYTLGANVGVRYDLTVEDFIPSNGAPTVVVERQSVVPDHGSAGLWNDIRVEWLDASNAYATEVAEVRDEASIAMFGLLTQDPYQMHEITNATLAKEVALRMLQRLITVRSTYKFTLGWRHCLLEPMDVVTLTDAILGLDHRRVRITMVEETPDGTLNFEAEDYPNDFAGTGTLTTITNPPADDNGGVIVGQMGGDSSIAGNPMFWSFGSDQESFDGFTSAGLPTQAENGLPDTQDIVITNFCAWMQFCDRMNSTSPKSAWYELRFAIDGVIQDGPNDPVLGFQVDLVAYKNFTFPTITEYTNSAAVIGVLKSWSGSLLVTGGSQVTIAISKFSSQGGELLDEFNNPAPWCSWSWSIEWEPA